MIIDAGTSYICLRETNNLNRIISGSLFGVIFPIFITLILNYNVKQNNDKEIIKRTYEIICIAIICILSSLLVYNGLIPWWIVSLISVIAVFVMYFELIYIILKQLIISNKIVLIILTILVMFIFGIILHFIKGFIFT
jgi:hypothetical protein